MIYFLLTYTKFPEIIPFLLLTTFHKSVNIIVKFVWCGYSMTLESLYQPTIFPIFFLNKVYTVKNFVKKFNLAIYLQNC